MAGFFDRKLFVPAGFLLLLGAYCYWFWSPVAYELKLRSLTVFFRVGRKTFPLVKQCLRMDQTLSVWTTIRLWGNGGVFAGSGIFWNKELGVFRAYVTRGKPHDLVLIETVGSRIVISPEDPASFVAAQ